MLYIFEVFGIAVKDCSFSLMKTLQTSLTPGISLFPYCLPAVYGKCFWHMFAFYKSVIVNCGPYLPQVCVTKKLSDPNKFLLLVEL